MGPSGVSFAATTVGRSPIEIEGTDPRYRNHGTACLSAGQSVRSSSLQEIHGIRLGIKYNISLCLSISFPIDYIGKILKNYRSLDNGSYGFIKPAVQYRALYRWQVSPFCNSGDTDPHQKTGLNPLIEVILRNRKKFWKTENLYYV